MKIAIVDIETTDFLNNGGLIVEVGIVTLDLETGVINEVYNELVKEEGFCERHKGSWIFENSNLHYEDVLQAKPLDVAKIQAILDLYPATAYNKSFDFDFLRSRGIDIKQEMPCPMKLMTDVCKIPSPRGYGFKWPNVEESWAYLFPHIEYDEAHRGADDAYHEAMIVLELHKLGMF